MVLRSSDDGYPAVGFRSDGSVFFGEPGMTMTVTVNGTNYPLEHYNKSREYGLALFGFDFFGTTRNKRPGRDAILVPKFDGELNLNVPVLPRVVKDIVYAARYGKR